MRKKDGALMLWVAEQRESERLERHWLDADLQAQVWGAVHVLAFSQCNGRD